MKPALPHVIVTVLLTVGSSLLASVPFSISEFLAVNSGSKTNSLRDEDGDSPDWIEIFNSSASVENIGGWFLTDTANNPTKWRFPEGFTVPARSYFILFASGKDRTNTARLHTKLSVEQRRRVSGVAGREYECGIRILSGISTSTGGCLVRT